jgi:hypothetical protein
MISLPVATLEVIGQRIAPANSTSFMWRKLSESTSVQYWSSNISSDELLGSLREIVGRERLSELEQTTAYCIAAALLLKNRRLANAISSLEGIEKAFWLKPLAGYVSEYISSTNGARMTQRPRISVEQLSSSPNPSQIITMGGRSN